MKISIDSRTIQPGDYFIPVKGKNFDGRHFIKDALEKGGRLLDVDLHEYARKFRKKLTCPVIAITGSAGKTTTKDLLFGILSQKYRVSKTHENQNNEFGVPLTLLSASDDTEILIVEMGMRKKGDIHFLTKIICPTHVVITSIGLSHIEFFKHQKEIAAAKGEIFRKPLQWETKDRFAFINFSTPYHDYLSKKATKSEYKVIGFSGNSHTDTTINLCYEIGHHFGLSDNMIEAGIAQYQSSGHRLQKHKFRDSIIIDDTYNANPDGVKYALEHLKKYRGRKLFVFGDMLELGQFSATAHQDIVESAIDAGVDIVCTYGELTQQIHSDTLQIYHFKTKEDLESFLRMEIKPGDVTLVKGSRGLKMETIIEGLLNS